MFLQEYYFRKSLEEVILCDIDKLVISIDHYTAKCVVNGKIFSLIFPKYMISLINTFSKNKEIDFYFQGLIVSKRKWVYDFIENKNSIIINSFYGRDTNTKYILDIEYYKNMSRSKFTLCPKGDCPWTYRFFESIMCFSIPILEDNSDMFCSEYFYFKIGDKYEYNYSQALSNYEKFIKTHSFIDKIF